MTYATLREALYDFFLHTMPHLFPTAVIISEDVFTALPYAKGRRYFDAVALIFFREFLYFGRKWLYLYCLSTLVRFVNGYCIMEDGICYTR